MQNLKLKRLWSWKQDGLLTAVLNRLQAHLKTQKIEWSLHKAPRIKIADVTIVADRLQWSKSTQTCPSQHRWVAKEDQLPNLAVFATCKKIMALINQSHRQVQHRYNVSGQTLLLVVHTSHRLHNKLDDSKHSQSFKEPRYKVCKKSWRRIRSQSQNARSSTEATCNQASFQLHRVSVEMHYSHKVT